MSRVDHIAFIGDRHSKPPLEIADAGTKAVNLARLDRLGLRVPSALVLSAALSQEYFSRGALPPGFAVHLASSLRQIEDVTGLTLGGGDPLLLSVRSSSPATMPGMLQTLLNVGLTENSVHHLIRRSGNPWLAWDCYRRLVRAFAETVHHVDREVLDDVAVKHLARAGAHALRDLDPLSMRDLARESAKAARAAGAAPLPDDPFEQVVRAVEAVLASWHSPCAREYRRIWDISDDGGTGVVVQAMAFGNSGVRSGTGVAFTRNPATGANELYVDFLWNAQGDELVSGREPIRDTATLRDAMPTIWAELEHARPRLEREFGDMQDVEFTVEDGQLFFMQTRDGKRTPWAAVQVAVDLVRQGVIGAPTALQRLETYDLTRVVRRSIDDSRTAAPIARAIAAGFGVATGGIVFDADRARRLSVANSVVLVREDIATEDLVGIAASAGVLTAVGGRTSHAAIVARQLGKACAVSCRELRVDAASQTCTIGRHVFREGDVISIDGATGLVYE
ncbi:MAG TPA: PEP/pyruvate-binding domain-containing protein, partial [Vicinamibacterales bacterium]|nr:PEP/pyruvate-binding domain-containing protein [Vicinamibacterales bacterium]